MKIAILGYGKQGASALKFFDDGSNDITICDKDENLIAPENIKTRLGEDYLKNLEDFDIVVRAPGLHPSEIVKNNSENILSKVTTNTNEFFKACPSKNIIGVTGTKGKGTTSTLITEMLKVAGYSAQLGGNFGTPPIELLENSITQDDWIVLELANFQLIDLKYSPKYAVCVLVEPEHLDWHTNLDEYISAKKQLFTNQTVDNYAVYYKDNELSTEIASVSPAKKFYYYDENLAHIDNGNLKIGEKIVCPTEEIKLLGEHNWQNICAAITVIWQITPDLEAIRKVVTTMTGLPYRNELRRIHNNISYYNDSFSTAPIATVASINSIKKTKVLIVGGFERGISLDELMETIKDSNSDIRHILIIGQSQDRVAEALEKIGFTNYTKSSAQTMDEIVPQATSFAKDGDAVVLSPGFASFGMFKNFEQRGDEFNKTVEKL